MSETIWPSVSVVMPVLNEEVHLESAVSSILAQDYVGSLDLCIALGPSTDATNAIAHRLAASDPRVSTVANPTGRRSTGLNLAIAATKGLVVVRVDGHAVLPQGYVSQAVRTLLRTGAVNVGGVQDAHGNTPFEDAAAAAHMSRFGTGGARFHVGGNEGPVDTVFLGVFLREALVATGGFDHLFEPNEDYELNVRLRGNGGIVWFDPSLRVRYVPRGSLRLIGRQFFHYGKGKRRVLRRHPSSLRIRQFVPPVGFLGLVVTCVASFWTPWALVAPLGYIALTTTMALVIGRTSARTARLVLIFPVMHIAWALGFFFGGWRVTGRRNTTR